PVGLAVLVAWRALWLVWFGLTFVCVVVAGRVARRSGFWPRPLPDRDGAPVGARQATSRRASLLCLAAFAALAGGPTWPLATSPARLSRNDNADTILNEWTMAWVAHQLPRHPFALFEANSFYPEHDTLAFSEPLVVQGVMAMPVIWLGGSPVLAYNLVLL